MPIWIAETISTCPRCKQPERKVIEVRTRTVNVKVCNVCNPDFHKEVKELFEKGKKRESTEEPQKTERPPL